MSGFTRIKSNRRKEFSETRASFMMRKVNVKTARVTDCRILTSNYDFLKAAEKK